MYKICNTHNALTFDGTPVVKHFMKSVATLPVTRYNFEHAAKKSCRRQRR